MTRSAEEISESAEGGFKTKYITQTNSVCTPIVDHISNQEQLQYLFYHQYKGYRVFEPDGEELTPDHKSGSWGKRFLAVTDNRILYIVGKEDGDKIESFEYDDIDTVDYNRGWTHGRINWTMPDGKEYKFADTGSLSEDIEDAGEYIEKRLQTVSSETDADDTNGDEFTVEGDGTTSRIEEISGINSSKADALRKANYGSVSDIRAASQEELSDVEGISNALAARIKADIGGLEVTTSEVEKNDETTATQGTAEREETSDSIESISGIDAMVVESLCDSNYDSYEDILMMNHVELADLAGVDDARAARIKTDTVNLDYDPDENPIANIRDVLIGVKFEDATALAEEHAAAGELQEAEKIYEDLADLLEEALTEFDSLSEDHSETLAERRQTIANNRDDVVHRRKTGESKQAAVQALEDAEEAKMNGKFETAEQLFRDALERFNEVSELSDQLEDETAEPVENIETVQQSIETVTHLKNQREQLTESLETAERSFQEAIAGYADRDQTLAKIRFRQARDEFETAQQLIKESTAEILEQPIVISAQPQQSFPKKEIDDFSQLSNETAEVLSTTGITSVQDISIEPDSLIPSIIRTFKERGVVTENESTFLTILSWWNGDQSATFNTKSSITNRFERAKHGFEETN